MPFWRRRSRKKTSGIKKLTGSPYTNIPRWLYERTKRIKTNPLNPGESTKTKDKKINIPNLQKTLMSFTTTINKLIDEVNKIPPIEKRMDALEKEHRRDMKKVKAWAIGLFATKANVGHFHATAAGGKKGGKVSDITKMEKGGSTNAEEKERQKLIDRILRKING